MTRCTVQISGLALAKSDYRTIRELETRIAQDGGEFTVVRAVNQDLVTIRGDFQDQGTINLLMSTAALDRSIPPRFGDKA